MTSGGNLLPIFPSLTGSVLREGAALFFLLTFYYEDLRNPQMNLSVLNASGTVYAMLSSTLFAEFAMTFL